MRAGRFWHHVEVMPSGCWEWTAHRNSKGYGRMAYYGQKRGTLILAHRFAYMLMVGPIPDGLTIDHLCRNRACVNPSHLEAVTHTVNVRRGSNTHKTHCVNGHELTGDNVYPLPGGHRICRVCKNAAAVRYRARLAMAA